MGLAGIVNLQPIRRGCRDAKGSTASRRDEPAHVDGRGRDHRVAERPPLRRHVAITGRQPRVGRDDAGKPVRVLGDQPEQGVADCIAEGIVDDLEPVDVEHDRADDTVAVPFVERRTESAELVHFFCGPFSASVFMATLALSAAFAGVVIILRRQAEGSITGEGAWGLAVLAFVASTVLASYTGHGALAADPTTPIAGSRGFFFVLEVLWLGIKTFGIVGVLMAALSGAWFGWRFERILAVFRTTA